VVVKTQDCLAQANKAQVLMHKPQHWQQPWIQLISVHYDTIRYDTVLKSWRDGQL